MLASMRLRAALGTACAGMDHRDEDLPPLCARSCLARRVRRIPRRRARAHAAVLGADLAPDRGRAPLPRAPRLAARGAQDGSTRPREACRPGPPGQEPRRGDGRRALPRPEGPGPLPRLSPPDARPPRRRLRRAARVLLREALPGRERPGTGFMGQEPEFTPPRPLRPRICGAVSLAAAGTAVALELAQEAHNAEHR